MTITSATELEVGARAATRFFWAWLFAATSMSVAGNVTHAIMNAPRGTVALAAAAAVVPPAVLLGSTHSVALLIKMCRLGVTYWCALMMTVALAGCAFVLSFDALRDLAVSLGFHPGRAWLWPVAIDVSIAQSTLALLTLAPSKRSPAPRTVPRSTPEGRHTKDSDGGGAPRARKTTPARRFPAGTDRREAPPAAAFAPALGEAEHVLAVVPDTALDGEGCSVDPAAVAHWRPTADQLVRDGITSKDPQVVAAILAEHAAGTPPSTIGRRQNVHHTTVARILSAATSVTI